MLILMISIFSPVPFIPIFSITREEQAGAIYVVPSPHIDPNNIIPKFDNDKKYGRKIDPKVRTATPKIIQFLVEGLAELLMIYVPAIITTID